MSSIKSRFSHARAKFLRRSSATSTTTRSITSSAGSERSPQPKAVSTLRKSVSLQQLPEAPVTAHEERESEPADPRLVRSEILGTTPESQADLDGGSSRSLTSTSKDRQSRRSATTQNTSPSPKPQSHPQSTADLPAVCPEVRLEEPTPVHPPVQPADLDRRVLPAPSLSSRTASSDADNPSPLSKPTPPSILHRQSPVASSDAKVIKDLPVPDLPRAAVASGPPTATADYFSPAVAKFSTGMLHRKIWVKRPNASATLVQIREDDLVDDVRDLILKKYANSLGRSFDAPDVTLKIISRDGQRGQDRILGPEEEMCRTLDAYFPGGQTVNEALVIDVPQRRTPKPSPYRAVYAHHDDATHHQTEYFPPMSHLPPMPAIQSSPAGSSHEPVRPLPVASHSIAVLNTGQIAQIPFPSPGGGRPRKVHRNSRPEYIRHNTASPTALTGGIPSSATRPSRPRADSSASEAKNSSASNNPIPTPPAPADPNMVRSQTLQPSNPSTPRIASPTIKKPSGKVKKAKPPLEAPSLPAGLQDGSVPPINVLIVEDNIINLRILEQFMQRLKVRWQRAMNGKEAVTKWKAGGFHLVLMDIQLPVMNGLEATKEIRRLERVNSIGVFSSGSNEAPNNRLGQENKGQDELIDDDRLGDKSLFKSPVIVVALTASSLQSDRHEALAAGCNDFLTKVRITFFLEFHTGQL